MTQDTTHDPRHPERNRIAEEAEEACTAMEETREQLRLAHGQLRAFADDLGRTVLDLRASRAELERSYLDTLNRLTLAAAYKDDDTGDHILRMAFYSEGIAAALGMHADGLRDIRVAAPMHDVGKIGTPDAILLKPGRLTPEEFTVMQQHAVIGEKILSASSSRVVRIAATIAGTHHERWDGSGYPRGLSGEGIPLEGRIVAVADVFDALTSKRPYKPAFELDKALGIMREGRGTHFDPGPLDAFLEIAKDLWAARDGVSSTLRTGEHDG
ncbi:HD-GYP domain-containing protein [Nitratidesulfovibrio sp. SRB-5]|uniref:HD-GYP domain-containing protein n=1 Tax=Nitratidesulfovibrio sp. SRB-5 TaxID=2872636 RepID=UPI0010286298|nr:HD domain-containing phosphohydrolase [Nitratidesulfovibrio sp. SRB-5]MBZ2170721.1 HD domain-containing protein [Nitratidesulfovibrio sp. SRB-5]RXF76935.1 HD domain-containing protein [Desulfovibrio sp. DS-1]